VAGSPFLNKRRVEKGERERAQRTDRQQCAGDDHHHGTRYALLPEGLSQQVIGDEPGGNGLAVRPA
jgi:hypothetical protein